jgi:hypothetical protein
MSYDSNLLRLPDPTTNPAGPGFVAVSLQDNKPGLLHELNDGTTVSVSYAGSYFTINISYPELTVAQASSFFPTIAYLTGGFSNFYVQLPQYVNPSTGAWATGNNTLIAKGNISIGSRPNEIVIPNWSTRGGDYTAGSMLKFDNSKKLYLVAYTSMVGDTKTIGLHCDILQPGLIPTAGFEPNNLRFRVRMVQAALPQLTAKGVYDAFNISVRENIR